MSWIRNTAKKPSMPTKIDSYLISAQVVSNEKEEKVAIFNFLWELLSLCCRFYDCETLFTAASACNNQEGEQSLKSYGNFLFFYIC
jgi:hypothetical protein